MNKENSIILEWIGKIALFALTSWAGWATHTLIRHDSEIAVLRYNVLKVAMPAPGPTLAPRPKSHPVYAFPLLPIPGALGTNLEESNEKKSP